MNRDMKVEWLKRRQRGVGSSDSPVLALGKVFRSTPTTLYTSKIETITDNKVLGEEDNPHLRRGNLYEPLAIAMFEEQTGIKVYSPDGDEERYNDFQVFLPGSPLYADFDGLCEDGWVLEAKAPLQRVCDSFRSNGVRDYYYVQCHHLAIVANEAQSLPGLGGEWRGKIKGTRLVVYEPENAQVQIVEFPIDQQWGELIRHNADHFWQAVEAREPPRPDEYQQPPKTKKKAKYTAVDGEAWRQAVERYRLAKERQKQAEAAMEAAKKLLKGVMAEAELDAVQIGPDKFSYREQAGARRFNTDLLKADFPDLDLEKYKVRGEPFRAFRHYGPKDRAETGDETLDKQVLTIQRELEEFAGRELSLSEAMEEFDDLRGRADLYASVLEAELEDITDAVEAAAKAATKQLGGEA